MDDAMSEAVEKQQAHLQSDINELERAVAERTRELQEAYDALKRKIAERERAADETVRTGLDWERSFDAIPDPIAILDEEHRIVRVNRAMAERLGAEPKECVGHQCFAVVHGTDEPPSHCPHAQLLKDSRAHVVETYEEFFGGHYAIGAYPLTDDSGRLVGGVHAARDITERVEAEIALRDTEAQQATILKAARTGIGLLRDRVFQWVNAHMLELTGYGKEELLGKNARMLYETKEEYERVGTEKYAQIRESGTGEMDTQWRRKDGSKVDVHLRSTTLDPENLSAGVIFTATDITDRNRAVEALRNSEARWRSLTENSPDYISLLDKDGSILFFNREFPGPMKENVVGTLAFDYMLPEEKEGASRCLEHVLRTGEPAEYETSYRMEEGELRYFASRIGPVRQGGQIVAFTVSSRDITEQKRAQQALEASEEKYRTLVEAAQEAIGITDPEENILFANRTFARVLGYEVGELVGRNLRQLADEAEYAKYTKETEKRRSGQATKYEPALYTKTGGRRYFSVSAAPLFDEQEVFTGSLGLLTDITDRKRAEEALRESEERYRSIFEHSPEMIVLMDAQGTFVEANDRGAEWLGYRKEDYLGKHVSQLPIWSPEDKAKLLQLFARRPRGEKIPPYEVEFVREDGKKLVGRVHGTLIKNDAEEVAHILLMVSDVSKEKEAEVALRAERDRAQRYLDIAAVMFVALDDNGNITLVNRRACETLGYAEKDLVGSNWFLTCLPEETREEAAGVYQRLMAGEVGPAEYHKNPIVTSDGVERLVAWHNTVLRDETGRIVGTLSSGEDITERQKALDDLRISEARFRSLIEQSPIGIAVYHPSGRPKYGNPAMQRIDGLSEEAAERVMTDYNILEDKQLEAKGLTPLLRKAFRGQAVSLPVIAYDLRDTHASPDDECRAVWIETSIFPVKDEQGKVREVVLAQNDVSDRKHAEEQLRQREAELAHMGRVQALGEMSTTLAHEINQPLSAIANYVRGINRRIEKGAIEFDELNEVLGLVSNEVNRASGIISHVRKFARKGEPHRSTVNLGDLIRGAIELVEADARKSKIRIQLEMDDNIPTVLADRIQIEQVLVNIVRNAIESMSGILGQERILGITAMLSADREVEIAVSDTGKGLDPGAASRVFDAFYTTKSSGLGMGLAISRTIIERHGGRIWVASNLPQGTIVHCMIPVSGNVNEDHDEREADRFSGG